MADRYGRTLHVSKIYQKYSKLDMSAKLKNLHDDMYNNFTKIAKGTGSGSASAARELQTFFQILKESTIKQGMSMKTKNSLDQIASQQEQHIINNMIGSVLQKLSKTNQIRTRLFQYTGNSEQQGIEFEKEIQAIIGAINSITSNTNGRLYQRRMDRAMQLSAFGREKAGLNSEMIDYLGKELISETFQSIQINNNKSALSEYVAQHKEGKIDASGLRCEWTIISTATPYLNKIALLLSQASFTAKSYRSKTQINNEWVESRRTELKLGDTDLSRVFLTIFQGAGFAPPVAFSAYKYILNTSDMGVKMWASRLRFIYELTGYGQSYGNKAINDLFKIEYGIDPMRANYIIYNDPSTENIYVRSTADIIQELWENIKYNLDDQIITISKAMFS